MTPRVCVALGVRNGAGYLREAIESVLAQEGVPLELRIYDNGSTDGSLELARSYEDDARVTVTANDSDLGYYGSLQRALVETEAELYVPWASDDVMEPGNLREKVALLDRTGAGFVCGPVHFVDDRGEIVGAGTPVDGLPDVVEPPELFLRFAPRNGIGSPGTVVVRTEAARAAGGFVPELHYPGDWDLWVRLSLRCSMAVCRERLVRYRLHAASGTSTRGRTPTYAAEMRTVMERAFADPLLPPELRRLRGPFLARTLLDVARMLAEDGHLLSPAGEAAYARAFEAVALQPDEPGTRDAFAACVRLAGLRECPLPLEAVLELPRGPEERRRAYAGIRALDAAGLIGHLALAVEPAVLESLAPELEEQLGAARAPIDAVPSNGLEPILDSGPRAVLGREPGLVARAEARGLVALPLPEAVEPQAPPVPGPRVSIVVPCWSQAHFLPEAVASAAAQTFRPLEVIVVDDGSPDDAAAVAERLIAAHPEVEIRLVRKENGGLSSARNAGIRVARGEYVCCLDADDRLTPAYVEECVRALDADPGASIAYGTRVDFGGPGAQHRAVPWDFAALTRANRVSVASMFRRQAWADAGGYDETLDSYEDWDFWISCGEHGHGGVPVPSAVWEYRVRADGMYAGAVRRDPQLKAQIVLKHPGLYTPGQLAWANGVLAGDPEWSALQTPVGVIPEVAVRTPRQAPLVSVIVPTHDRPELLREALQSLADQILTDFEVLVVNDAGVDVRHVVDEFADRLDVTHLVHDRNRQLAAARNTGLRAARGRYVAYLDDDDVFYPHHLYSLVGALEASGARVAYSDAARARVHVEDGRRTIVGRDVPYSFDFSRERFLYANYVPVNCVVHERACLDRVGLFDEELGTPLEDWELWIRLSQVEEFLHLPVVTCEFREADSGRISTNVERFAVNRQRIVDKHAALVAGRPDLVEAQLRHLGVAAGRPAPPPQRPWILAFADELLADPELLAVAAGALGERLGLLACGPAPLERELRERLGELGCPTEDVHALPDADLDTVAPVRTSVVALLSRRPSPAALADVARLDAA